jgi:hypothetical protein
LGTGRLGSRPQLERAPLDRPDPSLEVFEHTFPGSCRFHRAQPGRRRPPPLFQRRRSAPERLLGGFGSR